jgi:8-oxo-dGTP pyrophosphatase MutT (NUDIX family)
MQVVYANQTPPTSWKSAIFLAGPTPRKDTLLPSWRPEALRYLKEAGYDGVVFVPEDEDGTWAHNYDDQIEWEELCLNLADIIVFWIPRELTHMPAFTTNDEWGYWKAKDPLKLILGTPPDAPKVRYQRYYAEKLHIPMANNLRDLCALAYVFTTKEEWHTPIGINRVRTGGERFVPLHIWRTPTFQSWYEQLRLAGNTLLSAKVEWVQRLRPRSRTTFYWVLHVDVYIAAEGRNKVNEVVIGRPDISSVLIYEKKPNLLDSRVLLVKEFRSAVNNKSGYILELPGGSSITGNDNPLTVAIGECHEEVGLEFSPERFIRRQSRQLAATGLSHRSHLFSVEVSETEMDDIVRQTGVIRGVESETERTWSLVMTYREILADTSVDWSMLGMITSVLTEETPPAA